MEHGGHIARPFEPIVTAVTTSAASNKRWVRRPGYEARSMRLGAW